MLWSWTVNMWNKSVNKNKKKCRRAKQLIVQKEKQLFAGARKKKTRLETKDLNESLSSVES